MSSTPVSTDPTKVPSPVQVMALRPLARELRNLPTRDLLIIETGEYQNP